MNTTNEIEKLYNEKLMSDMIENDNFFSHIFESMAGEKSIKILAIFNTYVLDDPAMEAKYLDYVNYNDYDC